jgi:hypothetical protein
VLLLSALLAASVGASLTAEASNRLLQSPASLAVTVWPAGMGGTAHHWTLRCAPAGGTLPNPAAACRRLFALPAPFAPTPPGTACTMIYGGPQVARVIGTFRGGRIWTTLRRRDGCEIARWNRVVFLLR